jgi:hypothetical protein
MSLHVAVDNVTTNKLLPERIDTPGQELLVERLMKTEQLTREQASKATIRGHDRREAIWKTPRVCRCLRIFIECASWFHIGPEFEA